MSPPSRLPRPADKTCHVPRLIARLTDDGFKFGTRNARTRPGTGGMDDLFFANRAVEIIGPKPQSKLRDWQGQHDPESLDMIDIIEDQPGKCHHLHVFPRPRALQMMCFAKLGMSRMKREEHERLEAARLILDITDREEMLQPFFDGFHMAVHHRSIRAEPRLCAVFIVSIHSAAVAFFGQMICRTRSDRISAPPPGRLSSPASCRCSSTSRIDLPVICAKFTISTGVKA